MPEAKVINQKNVAHATVGQPGAKVVTMPQQANHTSAHGARVVNAGAIPGQPAIAAQAMTNGVPGAGSQIAPGTSVAQVIQRPQNAGPAPTPRKGVGARPSQHRGAPTVAPTRVVATPAPVETAPVDTSPLAPFTFDQCMFLNHLCEGFFVANGQNLTGDLKAVAESTITALQSWMVRFQAGTAREPKPGDVIDVPAASDTPVPTEGDGDATQTSSASAPPA